MTSSKDDQIELVRTARRVVNPYRCPVGGRASQTTSGFGHDWRRDIDGVPYCARCVQILTTRDIAVFQSVLGLTRQVSSFPQHLTVTLLEDWEPDDPPDDDPGWKLHTERLIDGDGGDDYAELPQVPPSRKS